MQHSYSLLISATVLIVSFRSLEALDNGLARTPHMGYNTWNCYAGDSRCRSHVYQPSCLDLPMYIQA